VPEVTQVDSVEQDRTSWVVHAQQQGQQGGLAGAARPHNADRFAATDDSGDVR